MNKNGIQNIAPNICVNFDQLLGKGEYAMVYQGTYTTQTGDSKDACIKIFKRAGIDENLLKREKEILLKLQGTKNPNIVQVFEILDIDQERCIVMEKCEKDLEQVMYYRKRDQSPFTKEQYVSIIKDILNGYKACLSEKIIHRDLKPANVLVANGVYKLTGFGMGRIIEDMNKQFPLSKRLNCILRIHTQAKLIFIRYLFFIMIKLGVMFHQLAFQALPFDVTDMNQLKNKLKAIRETPFRCQKNQTVPEEISNLIERMLLYSEEKRIGWDELYNCPALGFTNANQLSQFRIKFIEKSEVQNQRQPSNTQYQQVSFAQNQQQPIAQQQSQAVNQQSQPNYTVHQQQTSPQEQQTASFYQQQQYPIPELESLLTDPEILKNKIERLGE